LSKDTNWETDIALIKSDIRQIQKFFTRVEDSMDMMVDLSKNVAVQSEVLEYTKEKLNEVEKLCEDTRRTDEIRLTVLNDRLEEYRRSSKEDHQKLADHNANKRHNANKEILDRLDSMERSIHTRINEQQKKINNLENWRYYMMGVGAVVVVLLARVNWPELFG
jgi:DNA anti-recombination protein RmuC